MPQNRLIIMLAAVLFAVVAVSVGLLYIVPGEKSSGPSLATPEISPMPTSSGVSSDLNSDTFQLKGYQVLNTKPVQDGLLPVQPPAGVGKANPFI